MLNEIKKFYKKTKLTEVEEDNNSITPITYVHVFHKEYPRFPYIELPKINTDESELELLLEIREEL